MNANRDEVAAKVLVFLSGQPEELSRFFALCGVDPSTLRDQIGERGFQDGLFDHLMTHEPLLLAFCEDAALQPEHFVRMVRADRTGNGEDDFGWSQV